jgi:hypothetical protein
MSLYRVLSSSLAAVLAAIAIGVLIWAQINQGRGGEQQEEQGPQQGLQLEELLVSAPSNDPSSTVASSENPVESRLVEIYAPIWLPIEVRVVGLCNLLGLFFQIAVGLSTLLSSTEGSSAGEISLEILALNRAPHA